MNYEQILCEVDEKILTVTLNRPEKLNAHTPQMRHELFHAYDRADGDDDIRAVIVTGAGRGFCSGADLALGADTFNRNRPPQEGDSAGGGGEQVGHTRRLFNMKKPVIGAINGPSVGIGLTMTLAMDYRLASETARFGFVFTRLGIAPEESSSWLLPRLVGVNQALDWLLSGKIFDAEEALKGGLIRSVHPEEELLAAAREIARHIAENTSPISVALTRQLVWRMLMTDDPMEADKIEGLAVAFTGGSMDAQEGITSMLEKRSPNFQSKVSTDMPDFYPWWQEPSID